MLLSLGLLSVGVCLVFTHGERENLSIDGGGGFKRVECAYIVRIYVYGFPQPPTHTHNTESHASF